MSYSLQDLENKFEKMKELLEVYKRKYMDNEYTYNLANSDTIRVTIPENSVAHLLGISIDELRKFGVVKSNMDAAKALETFLDNGAYQLFNNKDLLSKIFSKDFEKKLSGFDYNAYLRIDDIYCIIKYNSERTYQSEDHADICDYFIVRRDVNTYYVLGVIKQNGKYRPVTSRVYDDFSEFDKFMSRIGKNQDFTYPYQYKVENDVTGFALQPIKLRLSDKKELLDKVMNISRRYGGVASVASDYSAFMNRTSNNYQKNNNEHEVLKTLISSIYGNEVLTYDRIKDIIGDDTVLSDDIKELIDAWNDSLVSNGNNGIAVNSFSAMESKFLDYKEKNETLTTELTAAQEKIALLEKEKEALIAERDSSNAKVKVLTDAFETVKTM